MQIIDRYFNSDQNIKDFYIAFFLAIACFFSYIEGFIPKPVPGIKLGLSNSIVMIFIVSSLYKIAFFISVSKVIVVSLFAGYFLSPAFVLGISGSILSALSMILFHKIFKDRITVIGLSVSGAFFHITAQLMAAYLILPSLKYGIFFISGILLITSFSLE
jgi:heptaprenyl diphosphate synthase